MAHVSDAQFENLPIEVLLQILTQISDIHCLWNLLISSPVSSRVFDQYRDEIFWSAVSDSIIPSQTQEVIRCVISLRTGAFRNTPLDQLVRKVRDREAGIVLGQSSELGYSLPTMDSKTKPSLSVMRSTLAVAGRVHALSRLCIEHYLESLAAAKTEGRLDGALEWPDDEQPSWTEEQRTIRAFWRVQLVLELNLAARTSQIQSSVEGNESWKDLDIESFYDSSTSNLKVAYHEVMTAVEFLKEPGSLGSGSLIPLVDRLPPPGRPAKNISPSTAGMPTNPATRRSSLVLPADGLWIVDSMGRNAHSPIKYAGFGPYRSMGFAIWDRERLAMMGLASPPGHGRVTGLGSYFPSWLKLLNSRDLTRAEERMREAECRGGRLNPLQPMIQDNAS